VLKKLLILLVDVKASQPLGGELTGYRKLVVGRNTWRIVYRIADATTVEICEVWAVGARADAEVYAEASATVRRAGADRPELVRLAEVIERLGKLAGDATVELPDPREPLPDWLAQRLIYTAGLAREEVAAFDLQAAVDRWTDFTSRPHR
jgi:mRNA interferase RelE/StbE